MQSSPKVSAADLLLFPLVAGLILAFLQLGAPALASAALITALIIASSAAPGLLRGKKPEPAVAHCFIFGLSVLLLPLFGGKAVLPSVLIFLAIERRSIGWNWVRPWLPLLITAAAWSLFSFVTERGWEPPLFLYQSSSDIGAAIGGIAQWLQSGPPSSIRSFEWMLRLFGVVGIGSIVAGSVPKRSSVIAGISVGAVIAIPIAMAEVYLLKTSPGSLLRFPNANEYWITLGRVSGAASDPNSYGVGMLLIVPILWDRSIRSEGRKRIALRALCAASLVMALFSGSRTLFLGAGFIAAGLVLPRRRAAIACFLGAAGLLALLNVSPSMHSFATGAAVPAGVKRITEALTISNFEGAVFNRTLFLRAGYELFVENPWLGVGLERFRDFVVPLTFGMPGVIPLWSDNANNFYLAVAAELGIFGVLFFLTGLMGMQFRSLSSKPAKLAVLAFLAVLLLGPHLEFVEISALFGVLLGLSVEPRRERIALTTACALGLVPCIAVKSYFGQFGFYGWEQHGGRYYRWTSTYAQAWIRCDAVENETPLVLRAARPDSAIIEIGPIGLPKRQVSLRSGQEISVPMPCPASGRPEVVLYQLKVSPPFAPGNGGDGRVLGVQVVMDDPREAAPILK